ncbi:MAG TPA: tetratricopeptide repeat protein [Microbacterium sp.]|nr:tetratricopeptide repeat protein [Microbacterium sp.]
MADWLRIAHRGASGHEPENTLAAFRKAIEIGVDGVEMDIRLSADGEVVVLHDASLERTTDAVGDVARMTFAEIREADAGSGERVPTLTEALEALASLPDTVASAGRLGPVEATARLASDAADCNRATILHRALGLRLLASGDPNRARRHLERALALSPEDSSLEDSLAIALLRSGQRPRAQALLRVAEAGYRRIVLAPFDPAATDLASLRRLFEDAGLTPIPIAGQMPGADVSSADADERRAGEAALYAMVDATAALGGDQLNGVPYGVFGHPMAPVDAAARERSATSVGKVADYAHEHGITMTFEVVNRYETAMVNTAAQAMEYAELSGSDHLRIHLDSFHMAVEESDAAQAIRAAMPRLAYLELGQSGRGLLSTGAVDIPRLVQGALDDGYEGRWGVEAFSRSILPEFVADMLAIWREPYAEGVALAEDAMRVIRTGWAASSVGRRAQRLARGASDTGSIIRPA